MDTRQARHSVSVTGVITDDRGRALLIQCRDNHRWEPPGGVLEPGESIHDGLRREVREETGLDVEPVALTGVYKNMNRAIIALVFRCKTTGGQPELRPTRPRDHRWVTEAEIGELARGLRHPRPRRPARTRIRSHPPARRNPAPLTRHASGCPPL